MEDKEKRINQKRTGFKIGWKESARGNKDVRKAGSKMMEY